MIKGYAGYYGCYTCYLYMERHPEFGAKLKHALSQSIGSPIKVTRFSITDIGIQIRFQSPEITSPAEGAAGFTRTKIGSELLDYFIRIADSEPGILLMSQNEFEHLDWERPAYVRFKSGAGFKSDKKSDAFSLTNLLKEHQVKISAIKANKILSELVLWEITDAPKTTQSCGLCFHHDIYLLLLMDYKNRNYPNLIIIKDLRAICLTPREFTS